VNEKEIIENAWQTRLQSTRMDCSEEVGVKKMLSFVAERKAQVCRTQEDERLWDIGYCYGSQANMSFFEAWYQGYKDGVNERRK
jgi:hypothetical protein